MIKIRMAKALLENEEGMNHLWIQITPIPDVKDARIQLVLPAGIHRLHNLNHLFEDPSGEILIKDLTNSNHIFIEIFTREPVSIGEKTIILALTYKDETGNNNRMEHFVTLRIVYEEEMDDVIMDDEVVNKIKALQLLNDESDNHERIDYLPNKILMIDPNQSSALEKKYRIEG